MSSTLPPVPRRGSPAYHARVHETAQCATLDEVTARLHALWQAYGWRSTVDVMTEWVCAIDYIIPTAREAGYRDFTGAVITARWASEEYLSEDKMLAAAIRAAAEREEREGLSAHESFSHATAITDRLRENIFAWKPYVLQALRTAHATHDRDKVRAVLTGGPGIKDREWWVLRDGAAYLYQVAEWPMRAARNLGRPTGPPHLDWLATDHSIPPAMIMAMLPPGELSSDC